ncbi:MAG: SDR family oxidoreductase [Rhodothermales bacterium]|nr:SDR family oxidoreductase [Rhodothermales bacterium]
MNDIAPTYIVVGATGGIGSAVSRLLAANGAELILSARSEQALQSLATELGAAPLTVDATDNGQMQDLTSQVRKEFGKIDGIVCCVGSILLKPAHLTSDEEFDTTIDLNLRTAFNTVRAGVRGMMSTGGSIVLCTSAVAQTGLANHEAIAAAKSGIIGLARSAAATYAPRNIRVNCVAPGLTQTPMSKSIFDNEASLEASRSMHALGRLGKPEDIASAITWLLDPKNDWVTGQVIGVDGGLGQLRPR